MMPFKDLIHRKLERLGPSLTTRQSGRVWFRSGCRDHTQEHLQMNFSKSVDVTDAVVAEPAVQTADVPRSNASTQAVMSHSSVLCVLCLCVCFVSQQQTQPLTSWKTGKVG